MLTIGITFTDRATETAKSNGLYPPPPFQPEFIPTVGDHFSYILADESQVVFQVKRRFYLVSVADKSQQLALELDLPVERL